MIKIAIILSNKLNQLYSLPSVWQESDWLDLVKFDRTYKLIVSFERYFHMLQDENEPLNYNLINQFDQVFNSELEFQNWLSSEEKLSDYQFDMPDAQDYHRKLQSTNKLLIDTVNEEITTGWKVRHFDPDTGEEDPAMEKLVDLLSTTAALPELGLDNEYQYLYDQVFKNKVPLPDLFIQMIPVAIAAGRIDAKINY